MSEREKKALVPALRFPEFRGKGEWVEKTLGDVATFSKGKGLPKSAITPEGKNLCIHYGELFTKYQEVIDKVKNRTHLKDNVFMSSINDVLMPTSDVTPSGLAKACCINLKNVILGGDILIIRTNAQEISGEYLARYIRHLEQKVLQLVTGSTVYHLYATSINKLNFFLPPKKEEQQKIADCLSSLDELITLQTQKRDALKAHKKGLMQQLFPAEGKTQPKLRFPEFRGKGEWEAQKIEALAKRCSGHTPNKKKPSYYNGGIKWVSLADSNKLDNGYIYATKIEISTEGLKNSSAVLHPSGTVIVSRDAGVGKSAILHSEMAVSQHFIAWVCNESKLSNWFLYYILQILKPVFENIAVGSTIKTIGLPYFKELCISIPSLTEQQNIADCLSSLDALITAQSQKIDALKSHKKGLMQQLFPSLDDDCMDAGGRATQDAKAEVVA
ncbi:MAG: restriction endonuclease subunit S [Gammaproteobacteria bacterium]|nr:restriction endonuclease subunit S [Gammaproteobacteria bacterium]